jgi:hypothetical protein
MKKLRKPDMVKQRDIWCVLFFVELVVALVVLGFLIKPDDPYRLHGSYSNSAASEAGSNTHSKSEYELAFLEDYKGDNFFWLYRAGGIDKLSEGTFEKQEDGIFALTSKDGQASYAVQLDANRVILVSPELGATLLTRYNDAAVLDPTDMP